MHKKLNTGERRVFFMDPDKWDLDVPLGRGRRRQVWMEVDIMLKDCLFIIV